MSTRRSALLAALAAGAGILAAGTAGCGEPSERISFEVRFFDATAARRAREVRLIVYELDDGTISPCRELLAGGDGARIGLEEQLFASRSLDVNGTQPVSVVFASLLDPMTAVSYAEAADGSGVTYARDCTLGDPRDGDTVELTLH